MISFFSYRLKKTHVMGTCCKTDTLKRIIISCPYFISLYHFLSNHCELVDITSGATADVSCVKRRIDPSKCFLNVRKSDRIVVIVSVTEQSLIQLHILN